MHFIINALKNGLRLIRSAHFVERISNNITNLKVWKDIQKFKQLSIYYLVIKLGDRVCLMNMKKKIGDLILLCILAFIYLLLQ